MVVTRTAHVRKSTSKLPPFPAITLSSVKKQSVTCCNNVNAGPTSGHVAFYLGRCHLLSLSAIFYDNSKSPRKNIKQRRKIMKKIMLLLALATMALSPLTGQCKAHLAHHGDRSCQWCPDRSGHWPQYGSRSDRHGDWRCSRLHSGQRNG